MTFVNVLNKPLTYFGIHNHTDRSNFRLKDCINKISDLIDYAVKIGLSGIAITDHEVLSSHVEAIQYVKEQKENGKIPEDFTLALGNEIYLVDRETAEYSRENNEPMKFYHFLLVAKNRKGYDALKELSSLAWRNGYFFRGMERVPTYTDDLERVMENYKCDIIASTACVGSEFAQTILNWVREEDIVKKQDHKFHIHRLVTWYQKIFGEDFYIEIQPSYQDDQIDYNKAAFMIAKAYNIKTIIATDTHYLNKEAAFVHETYLKADEGEREVASFYSSTYMMEVEEMWEFFKDYTHRDYYEMMLKNTLTLMSDIEEFDLYHDVIVPDVKIPDFELQHIFRSYYKKYEYIYKYATSDHRVDRYHLFQIEKGFKKYKQEFNEENLERINEEYKELYLTSQNLGQQVSSYYLLTQRIVDIMWTLSLVGVSRGSAASWYTVYLLGITQLNPIKYNLPHWRHLTHTRPEMPDIDIDTEASQRAALLEAFKEEFGWENVLNISTTTKEKLRSAILTGCRGLGIDNVTAQNIANLIPTDKTGMWTLKDCLEGNPEDGKKPVRELQEEFEQHKGLREMVEAIEGLVSGRSVHASGIYFFSNGFLAQNALMKTTGGQYVTQFNMQESDYMGGLKVDALTVNALDRIRSCMDLLIEAGKIKWLGTLRETYEAYLHPDVIDMESNEMFKLLYEGEVLDAFQFDSAVGSQAVSKIYPQTFDELSAANYLMRLSPESGESPLDKFVRHKEDINEWYQEMTDHGLNEYEQELLKSHLLPSYGICGTQESMMLLSMEPTISDFGLKEANKLRKGVAKKSAKTLEECWEMFVEGCERTGCSEALKQYVWEVLFKPQFGYSFSIPHIAGYTMILMIELNLGFHYGIIYWKTACLTVNSGLMGELEGNANYGAIAKAVGDMKGIVLNPDINKSKLGFTPLEEENKILFGMKPISGLDKNSLHLIMERRPFSSFEDFVQRAVIGSGEEGELTISDKKGLVLIKAGCFDKLDPRSRRDLMADYVRLITPKKEVLTMANLPHIIDKAPATLKTEVEAYHFRQNWFGKKAKITKELEKEFITKYSKLVKYEFDNGKVVLDKKEFDKVYKKIIEPLRLWVITPEAAKLFNSKKMSEFWLANCMGTKEQWEMETVVFYSDKHELDYIPLYRYFDIDEFPELKPSNITSYKTWGRKKFPQYQLGIIAGTVVDKNKDKHIVYISTQYGVVPVKYYKGSFLHYDKVVVDVRGKDKVVVDNSWFKRGTKLVVVGYRRGDEFVPKVYKETAYKHTTMKINGFNQNEIDLQMEKKTINS